jgi:hypothetical protein
LGVQERVLQIPLLAWHWAWVTPDWQIGEWKWQQEP